MQILLGESNHFNRLKTHSPLPASLTRPQIEQHQQHPHQRQISTSSYDEMFTMTKAKRSRQAKNLRSRQTAKAALLMPPAPAPQQSMPWIRLLKNPSRPSTASLAAWTARDVASTMPNRMLLRPTRVSTSRNTTYVQIATFSPGCRQTTAPRIS